MVFGMLSWATYSALLKKKKHELSQLTLLEVVISFGFIFLIPIYFIEYQMGYRIVLKSKLFYDFILCSFISRSYIFYFLDKGSFFNWS